MSAAGSKLVWQYDWATVCDQILRVYETAVAADPRRVAEVPVRREGR